MRIKHLHDIVIAWPGPWPKPAKLAAAVEFPVGPRAGRSRG